MVLQVPSVLSNACKTTFRSACVLILFVPFFVLCVILFVCVLSICNSYNNFLLHVYVQATSFDGVFIVYSLPVYCFSLPLLFFIVVNKISIYLSMSIINGNGSGNNYRGLGRVLLGPKTSVGF